MFWAIDLKKDSVGKLFFAFSVPTVTAILVNALYVIIDGIFIGQGVGAEGLAAINIAYPIVNLAIALSLLIGTGGATLMSLHPRNTKFLNTCFSHIITLTTVAYILILALIFVGGDNLAYFLGSNENLLSQVKTYMYTCGLALIFLMLSNGMSAVVRNDKAPIYAFFSMIIGAVINIFLDWIFIFIFHWGIFGAAFATAIGEVITFACLVKYFLSPHTKLKYKLKKLKFTFVKNIVAMGFPSFTIEFTAALTNTLFNISFMRYLGELGVSAFCIVAYICYIFRSLFSGLSQGIQPIISYNTGVREYERVKKTFAMGHIVTFIISSAILLSVIFYGKYMVVLFTNEPKLVRLSTFGLLLYASCVIFQGANFINISYLQSRGLARMSNFLSVLRSIVFFIIALVTLPLFLKDIGVWLSLPTADFMCFFVSLYFLRQDNPFTFKIPQFKKKNFIDIK